MARLKQMFRTEPTGFNMALSYLQGHITAGTLSDALLRQPSLVPRYMHNVLAWPLFQEYKDERVVEMLRAYLLVGASIHADFLKFSLAKALEVRASPAVVFFLLQNHATLQDIDQCAAIECLLAAREDTFNALKPDIPSLISAAVEETSLDRLRNLLMVNLGDPHLLDRLFDILGHSVALTEELWGQISILNDASPPTRLRPNAG
jgi:hypothetical protein